MANPISRVISAEGRITCAQNAVTHPEVESVVGQTEGVNQRHRDNYVRLTTHAAFSCPSWASQVSRVRLSESTSQVRLDLVLVHGTRDKVDLCLSVHVPVPARASQQGRRISSEWILLRCLWASSIPVERSLHPSPPSKAATALLEHSLELMPIPDVMEPQPSNDSLATFMGNIAGPFRSRRASFDLNQGDNHSNGTTSALRSGLQKAAQVKIDRKGQVKGNRSPGGTMRALDLKWEAVSQGGSLSAGNKKLTCVEDFSSDERYAAAAGPPLNVTGVTEFQMTITKSQKNTGAGMLLGLIEDVGFQGNSEAKWGRVWGLTPWNGNLFGFPQGDVRSATRVGEQPGDALMEGDCRNGAAGTSVRVRFDAAKRNFWFKIDLPAGTRPSRAREQDWVIAADRGRPVVLPEDIAFRPFARCAHVDDCITLGPAIKEETLASSPRYTEAETTRPSSSPPTERTSAAAAKRTEAGEGVAHGRRRSRSIDSIEYEEPYRRDTSQREIELLEQVASLAKELEATRNLLDVERALRRTAEMRAEEMSRLQRLQEQQPSCGLAGHTSNHYSSGLPFTTSARDIERSLLREVIVSEMQHATQAGKITDAKDIIRRRRSRDRQEFPQ